MHKDIENFALTLKILRFSKNNSEENFSKIHSPG